MFDIKHVAMTQTSIKVIGFDWNDQYKTHSCGLNVNEIRRLPRAGL